MSEPTPPSRWSLTMIPTKQYPAWRVGIHVAALGLAFAVLDAYLIWTQFSPAFVFERPSSAPIVTLSVLALLAMWGGVLIIPRGLRLWSVGAGCVGLGLTSAAMAIYFAASDTRAGQSVLSHMGPAIWAGAAGGLLVVAAGGVVMWRLACRPSLASREDPASHRPPSGHGPDED